MSTAASPISIFDSHRSASADSQINLTAVERRLSRLGNARFAFVMISLSVVFLAIIERINTALWVLLPVTGYAILSVFSERAMRRKRRLEQAIAFHERIIARLEDRWAGNGVSGLEYLPTDHPCAADLDLFGKGSLFERICQCVTRAGRDTLARWILQPAEVQEARLRQEAVRDLRDRAEWRERVYILGSNLRDGINTTALAAWGEFPGQSIRRLRIIAPCLVGLTWLSVLGWVLAHWSPLFVGLFLVAQTAFALIVSPRVQQATRGLDRRSSDLAQLVDLLIAIERATFHAPLLQKWQRELLSGGLPPSETLRLLSRWIDRLDMTRNMYFALVSPFLLWTTQVALAIESWRRQTGPALSRWMRILGEIEALSSIAGYAAENIDDPFPEFAAGEALFDAKGLGHPLLPRSKCVPNDLLLDQNHRLLVISGSNMSGKSTLLRSVGINAVLAQMGAPVRASSLRMSRLVVGSTLRVQDSLQEGRSRFYAEISRLRRIVDLADGPVPMLFLLDEILHGTNSHDRKIGAEAIVGSLLRRKAIGLITTHDLALTQVADDLGPQAANVHFADELIDGELRFDFRLKEGPVRHGNALAMMRAIGLEVENEISF